MTLSLDHAVGATAFGRDVAGYAAGRPDYPEALFAKLADRCGLRERAQVLEIGPGTGQASRRMIDSGIARLVAVEPDPALADYLETWREPRLEVRRSGFDNALLGDACFDLVAAATSFHWLEGPPALANILRLLRPGGWFAMWWNVFHQGDSDPLFDMLFEGLARPPSLLAGTHYSLDHEARVAELRAAGFVQIEHMMFHRDIAMTPASLRALYATFSAVRSLAPRRRESRLEAVEARALATLGPRFDRRFRTPLYIGRRA